MARKRKKNLLEDQHFVTTVVKAKKVSNELQLNQVLGANATRNPGKSVTGTRRLPPTERRAIEILEAKDHWTKAEVRKAYKALIKVLHPDMNGGDRSQEEQRQEVVWAWDQIKDSRNFK